MRRWFRRVLDSFGILAEVTFTLTFIIQNGSMTMWSPVRPRSPAKEHDTRRARRRTLIWATLAALICGALGLGQPLEDFLRVARNKVRQHPASGEIVVVGIDERSLEAVGAWPWPRSRHAELVNRLDRLGARSIAFDVNFSKRTHPTEEKELADAIARSRSPVTLAFTSSIRTRSKMRSSTLPIAALRENAVLAGNAISYDYSGRVWKLRYSFEVNGASYPSMASRIAATRQTSGDVFLIDYSIDPRSVPTVSAVDVMSGKIPETFAGRTLRGRDVIVGVTTPFFDDLILSPGYGKIPGVYVQVLGAETLRSGLPRDIGWVPALVAAFVCATLALAGTRLRIINSLLATGAGLLLVTPLGLDAYLISLEVVPALLLLFVVGVRWTTISLRQSYQSRGTVNVRSGLLNLDALRLHTGKTDEVLIAARIGNYAQIAAALSSEDETALIEQIAQRLTLGSSEQTLYQGDEGIFAWFAPAADHATMGAHLEALHGFFRESLHLADKQVDLSICFGLDAESDRSPANRLGSALVACDEAFAEGLKWKAFDPATLVDASWKLSLLGQLDRAIENGDFWVAYQPKLDLKSGRIVGAEALARWTHPTKGAISPVDFILAAEQSDRIERLTHFVLDRAITAAARINAAGYPFNVAVNLSTRLISDPALTQRVADLLWMHGLSPDQLTLEVTETAAMGTGETNLETLNALRDLGVCISVDDYGTGLSTLEYLKKIPATEIKIDQTFVGAITRSHSDRLMVRSTIQLVHSLGHVVVAEGVEDQATIDALSGMGCDFAQGFFIGRPATLDKLAEKLGTNPKLKRAVHR